MVKQSPAALVRLPSKAARPVDVNPEARRGLGTTWWRRGRRGGIVLIAVALYFGGTAPGADEAEPDLQRFLFDTPSQPEMDHLFTALEPAQTGVTVLNAYDDPSMWGRRYRAFMGGAMGSGVAVGDFDRDGLVDLYVSTKTKPGRLYRNLGHWKFRDITEEAGLAEEGSWLGWLKGAVSDKTVVWRQGAVFADVNNDGWPDLFVCCNDAPNRLYLNQGDGTFQEEADKRGLAIVDGSVIGAFADFDRDGWLDVFILTNQVDGNEPSGRPDHLFRNQGRGVFTEVTAAAGISGPTYGHAAAWLDYDHDGWPDLYIANDFAGTDFFYRNNRDGTFTNVIAAVAPHICYSSMGVDIADVDNDGNIDVFVADMATSNREKDRRGLAASRDDVLLMGTRTDAVPQYMRNTLLLNTGNGRFREAACWAGIAATDWTWSMRFEDFDNDGWTDLHVTNGMVREANNSDVLTRMMRALSDQERINAMKRSPPLNETNLAYRNQHGLGFEPVTGSWGLTDVGISFGSATADFDHDGDLDLVYLNYDGGVSVYRNDVVRQNRVQVRLRGTISNRDGVGAIVRITSAAIGPQMRTMTVARGYAAGSELVAHFGLGPDPGIEQLTVAWPSGIVQSFADLEANFSYLVTEHGIVAPPEPVGSPALFRLSAAGESDLQIEDDSVPAIPDKEQVFLPFRTDRRGPGVAVADIDGDDHEDIFLAATTGSPSRLLRWREGRYVETAVEVAPSKVEDGPSLFLDIDGNGTRDLLVTRASANATAWPESYRPAILANDGRGRFTPTDWMPVLAMNAGAICAADIDGDGDLDVFLGGRSIPGRYPETPASVLLRNDGGRLVDATPTSPGLGRTGLVKSALFRDVDVDGRPDLVVALEWDFVRYWHNDGDGRFSDRTEQAGFASGGRGWWNGLASGDLNGDGRPDFVAGNLGLNTTYRASRERPATLFYGDLAQNGTKILAEAVYDGDTLFPTRAKADLGARFPFILRKYPRNDDFARATLTEVFGETTLTRADRFEADNFSSGVFLSQDDGSHRFAAFPRAAQISPMQGIVVTDLDGDGHADVCAVQNTDIATPRFHGGVGIFLRGNGDGTFVALEPARSGIIVPGNARALVVIDPNNDSRPDLFFTQHGGSSSLLINEAMNARWLRVQLAGNRPNADAVGARVTWRLSNGRTSAHEIGLGGGWLSQSTPDIFAALPAEGRMAEAIVTWPDGAVTRHDDAPTQGTWILRRRATP